MRNGVKKWLYVSSVYSLVPLFVACSHLGKSQVEYSGPQLQSKAIEEPVVLELKTEKGRITKTKYNSRSLIENYEQGLIVKEREEGVEFVVQNTYQWGRAKEGTIAFESTTIEKDGAIELNDLAFPELKEKIDFVLTPQSQVLKAGNFSDTSVFFVPPVPLPSEAVRVGDTWSFQRQWLAQQNGIPLELRAVGILKDILNCKGEACALIEISGHVGVLADQILQAQFRSELQGFLIFHIERGEVLWSRVQSKEWLQLQGASSRVSSCLSSYLIEPETWKLEVKKQYLSCDPIPFD